MDTHGTCVDGKTRTHTGGNTGSTAPVQAQYICVVCVYVRVIAQVSGQHPDLSELLQAVNGSPAGSKANAQVINTSTQEELLHLRSAAFEKHLKEKVRTHAHTHTDTDTHTHTHTHTHTLDVCAFGVLLCACRVRASTSLQSCVCVCVCVCVSLCVCVCLVEMIYCRSL